MIKPIKIQKERQDMKNLKLIKPYHIIGVAVGALFSATAIKIFVQQGNLVPSGVAGLTSLFVMEANRLLGINLSFSLLYFVINALLLSLVYKHLGVKFLTLSFLHVTLTSIFVDLLPSVIATQDMILIAVFGGLINGIGSSIALRMNGSAGGTDFIAIYYSMVKNKPMWDLIMFFNISMLVYYGWQYNWTLALYSILYQIVSTKIIETYHNRYKLSSIHIITEHPENVSDDLLKVVRHGITKFDGIGMYKKQDKTMLYMVANAFEVELIVKSIKQSDPCAFIEIASVQRIEGNYRQRPLD
ncbi:YitT family protein [Erysipelothrix urinaevulpis]|uniref:YitT family protein n=1 Tax=Erysipelothrix urinaevulpis TaxID=2683717 RepID=UPI001F228A93|nr:YitT family protein [Erysipelothrix urinaevulpis]